MASAATLPPPQNVAILTSKLYDADPDIRFMSLNDLLTIFNSGPHAAFLSGDYQQCAKTVDGFLHTLNDPNGEVQNLTIKCLGPFVNRTHPEILCPLIHKVANLPQTNVIDISISALAIRTIVVSLPRPSYGAARTKSVNDAYIAISKVLIPRLVGYIVIPLPGSDKRPDPPKGLLQVDRDTGTDSSSIEVLTEVARCFGPMLQPDELKALEKITTELIESERVGSVLKKKAVTALSTLAHYFSEEHLSAIISRLIQSLTNSHLTQAKRKLYLTVLGSIARAVPTKFGPHLKTLASFVLSALSQQELDEQMQDIEDAEDSRDPVVDEVREAALITLESFLSSCGPDMTRYLDDCIAASLRFLKYDPNVAFDDDDDEDEDEDDTFDDDEDFEEEFGGDDEDDLSWKVRRCAARALRTIISVKGHDLLENATTFNEIASTLTGQFKEREEIVRLEVLVTLAFLIKKTAEGLAPTDLQLIDGLQNGLVLQPHTRKRRRAASDISMSDPVKYGRFTGSISPEVRSPARQGPRANLASISPEVVSGAIKLFKKSTVPTRQAVINVLKELTIAQNGGMNEFVDSLVGPLVETLSSASGDGRSAGSIVASNSSSATQTTLQTETLQLIAELTKLHTSKVLGPHMPQIVPAVLRVTGDRQSKLACQALHTIEQLVKALTPPRWASTSSDSAAQLEAILATIFQIIDTRNVDLTVRQEAIRVLGIFLGRTIGPQGAKLVPESRIRKGLEMLFEASRNETTRLEAIKSIDFVASYVPERSRLDPAWLSKTCLELCGQLRKADRALRSGSLDALRSLITGRAGARDLDPAVTHQLAELLIPLLVSEDLQLLGPVLLILASITKEGTTQIVTEHFTSNICQLVASPTAGSVLEQLCALAEQVGERGLGQDLMSRLLKDVGVNGSPAIVGKVIGTLLVHGKGQVGVSNKEFLDELNNSNDDQRQCLALAVLGEVGLQSGKSASLKPDLFTSYFGVKSTNVALAAAVALGRAAAGPGNTKEWGPIIIARIKTNSDEQYLILHTIKELLQHNANEADVIPFAPTLWEATISASRTEGNRTIGAECVAALAMIEPKKFLSALQVLLSDSVMSVRGTAILALRDVFTITDTTYNKDLRPIMVDMLTTMMRDSQVDNRRSALQTFNAAARNKPALILPYLSSLMPLVIDQTFEDPSLIREVSMGPFKHKVDDGLELRKSAYETAYSIMEVAATRIDIVKVYDRVVAGIKDDAGIRTVCILMIGKLMTTAPEETVRRLDDIADQCRVVLAIKPKETAVRQEFEKADEAKRSVIKLSLDLTRSFPVEAGGVGGSSGGSNSNSNGAGAGSSSSGAAGAGTGAAVGSRPKWSTYIDDMKRDHANMVKDIEKENRDKDRSSS